MPIYTPYTYLIGWKAHNKYYYGVRYAKKANPVELWTKYKTSSKHVKSFVEEFGDPDIIEVRKTFKTSSKARQWEHKVLRRMKVTQSDIWLNQTDNKSICPEAAKRGGLNYTHTPERIAKVAKANTGKRLWNKDGIEIRSVECPDGEGWKQGMSESTKKAISKGCKGIKKPNRKRRSDEDIKKMADRNRGKKRSAETRKRISESNKGQKPRIKCDHCDMTGSIRNIKYWHNDNCSKRLLDKSV